MKRWDVLNELIVRRDSKRYLEVGVGDWACMKRIAAPEKTGVDPAAEGPAPSGVRHFAMESDRFFAEYRGPAFDLIFIDGLHHADQTWRDVQNSLVVLAPAGTIVLHDCNPLEEAWQIVPRPSPDQIWCGNCWKVIPRLRSERDDLDVAVLNCDRGLGVVRPHGGRRADWNIAYSGKPWTQLGWEDFDRDRESIANLVVRDDVATLL